MKWIKKGLIYAPDKKYWFRQLYGMMPTPEYLEKQNILRIYFGVTDKERNGRITYLDTDADDPSNIKIISDKFIIDIGCPGLFDDSGVIPSSLLNISGKKYLYYVGFQRCEKVPYMLFPGLAISEDEGASYKKYSSAPLIDRSEKNFLSNAAPYVMFDEQKFKMWYWIGKEWVNINNKKYIKAQIGYAESFDGIHWNQCSEDCINLNLHTEFSVGRPWILKEHGKYRIWYSIRYIEKLYRIGYAESNDGIIWTRKDNEAGIDVSEIGWDSQMICYPAVIKVKNKTYLFYNGNNNGETGFGYAELES